MIRYSRLLFAFLRDRSRNDLAYIGNFWSELASTMLYVITFILFVELLFGKIGALGSFSKDEFLFMSLIGQFTFYFWAIVMFAAMQQLIENVRTGAFDFLLLRPLSVKFYTFASAVRPVYGLFISVPNIILFCFIINWSNIHVTTGAFLLGVLVWIGAMLVLATIMFTLTMPVFTQGDATDLVSGSYALFSITEIPFDLLPTGLRYMSFTVLPTLLATAGSAYVMLNKGTAWPIVLGSICAGFIALLCYRVFWNRALSNYSSASS